MEPRLWDRSYPFLPPDLAIYSFKCGGNVPGFPLKLAHQLHHHDLSISFNFSCWRTSAWVVQYIFSKAFQSTSASMADPFKGFSIPDPSAELHPKPPEGWCCWCFAASSAEDGISTTCGIQKGPISITFSFESLDLVMTMTFVDFKPGANQVYQQRRPGNEESTLSDPLPRSFLSSSCCLIHNNSAQPWLPQAEESCPMRDTVVKTMP